MTQQKDPIFEFFRCVNIIQNLSQSRLDSALPGDMLLSHFVVLSHLQRTNEISSPAELAQAFQVTRPSMTNTLSKLEKLEWIEVSVDPNDRRGKRVVVSQKGSLAVINAMQIMPSIFKDIVEQLGPEFFEKLLPNIYQVKNILEKNRI